MPEGVMILGQWECIDIVAGVLLFVGLLGFLIGGAVTAVLWTDLKEKGHFIGIGTAAICMFLILISLYCPLRKGLRVTLTDPSKMPELVEKYDVVSTDGLILDIEERKDKR